MDGMNGPWAGIPSDPVTSVATVPDDEREVPAWQALKRWPAAELLATEFPLRWAVPDLLPEGLSLLVGAPDAGKSWLALDIALAVAAGGDALGALPVDAGRVLYLALEDGPRRVQDRIRLLIGAEAPAPDRLDVYTDWSGSTHAGRGRLPRGPYRGAPSRGRRAGESPEASRRQR